MGDSDMNTHDVYIFTTHARFLWGTEINTVIYVMGPRSVKILMITILYASIFTQQLTLDH